MNKEIINAFHPKYIETYMPELITKVRTEAAAKANGVKFGGLARVARVSLEPTEFRIYSKAGAK